MLAKVKNWIECNNMIDKDDIVLAACSGGPDSLALVDVLNQLRTVYGFSLAAAHVDHMFRGSESAADAIFVEQYCREREIPFYQAAINVNRYIKVSGRSAQDAARFLRYNYLRHTAQKIGGAKIATGHHRDDQAETILLHLLRGAGSLGLQGMKAAENGLIRPLLAVSRQEIEDYCRLHNLEPRLDPSNLKTYYRRNRVRLELLPLLEERFNPAIRDILCRTAGIIGDEHDFIRQAALEAAAGIFTEKDKTIHIDICRVNRLHIAVRREIFRLAIEKKLGHLTGITFENVEKMIELANFGSVGSFLHLPGKIAAKKGYNTIELVSQTTDTGTAAGQPPVQLAVPGATIFPALGIVIEARIYKTKPTALLPDTALFDRDSLILPVYVRTRLPGDRFWPKGMTGSKKLKEFFIDLKVPRSDRDKIPIVVSGDQIIWVGGYRQSEYGKITDNTKSFLQLTIIRQEETVR